eukprot:2740195-Pyramimonas_sp.AAC.1
MTNEDFVLLPSFRRMGQRSLLPKRPTRAEMLERRLDADERAICRHDANSRSGSTKTASLVGILDLNNTVPYG